MSFVDTVWLKRSLRTRQGWAGALTAFVPIALVLGRAPADIIVSIVAILFLVDRIIRRDWEWAKTPWITILLILWAYSVGRACFIPHGGKYIFSAFAWLRYICFAASAAFWALEDKEWRNLMLRGIAASLLFLSFDAILQYVTGFDIIGHPKIDSDKRLTASFNRPIVGMTIANMFAPMLFWLLDRKRPLLSFLFGTLTFVAILLSGERMALLFGTCVMLLWLFMLVRGNRKLWPAIIAGFCVFIILVSLRADILQRQIISSSQVISNVGASPYGQAWTSGLHVGEAYPLFGVGMQQFRYACVEERFGPLTNEAGIPRCYIHPHNAYIEWFAENGIIGFTGFIAFILVLLNGLRRRLVLQPQNMVLWGLAITIVVRLLPFFTSTSFFNNWSAIPFWLCVGWAMRGRDSAVSKSALIA